MQTSLVNIAISSPHCQTGVACQDDRKVCRLPGPQTEVRKLPRKETLCTCFQLSCTCFTMSCFQHCSNLHFALCEDDLSGEMASDPHGNSTLIENVHRKHRKATGNAGRVFSIALKSKLVGCMQAVMMKLSNLSFRNQFSKHLERTFHVVHQNEIGRFSSANWPWS